MRWKGDSYSTRGRRCSTNMYGSTLQMRTGWLTGGKVDRWGLLRR